MGDYVYRPSMKCETHGNIYEYLYCPECTISALRADLEKMEGRLNIVMSEGTEVVHDLRAKLDVAEATLSEKEAALKRLPALERVAEAAKVYYEAWPVLGTAEYANLDAALRELDSP